MTELRIEKAETKYQYACCVYLRVTIFAGEQNVPFERDFSDQEDDSIEYIGFIEERPVVTARYRLIENDVAQIERVAVAKNLRGQGYGKKITSYITDVLKKEPGIKKIVISAQTSALSFYEKLGYERFGDTYIDADMEHVKVVMNV